MVICSIYQIYQLQPKVGRNVSPRDPWFTRTFRHSPFLNLRASSGVKHDVHASISRCSIKRRCQGKIGSVDFLERLDLGCVIQVARGAVPRIQDERAAVWNGVDDQVGRT